MKRKGHLLCLNLQQVLTEKLPQQPVTQSGSVMIKPGYSPERYAVIIRQYWLESILLLPTIQIWEHKPKAKKIRLRIILDSKLKIPLTSQVLRDENILIATTESADLEKKKQLLNKGISVVSFQGKKIDLDELMKELHKREIISVLGKEAPLL